MQKQNLAIANFKMNLNSRIERDNWINGFLKAVNGKKFGRKSKAVLCVPALHLTHFVEKLGNVKNIPVGFGVQDCFWQEKGAFTGETSPRLIKSLGGQYVILGHSERRNYCGETNEMVAHKVEAALKNSLYVVLCIGESAEEKKNDATVEVLASQTKECLARINKAKMERVIVCYEPVWAISANKPDHLPNVDEIMGAKLVIKKVITQKFGRPVADKVPVIYGGSVDAKSVEEVCIQSQVQGGLIGSASLSPYELVKIVERLNQ